MFNDESGIDNGFVKQRIEIKAGRSVHSKLCSSPPAAGGGSQEDSGVATLK